MEGLTQEKPKKAIKEQVKTKKVIKEEKTDDWTPLKKETKTYEKEEEVVEQEVSDNKLKSFQDYLNLKK